MTEEQYVALEDALLDRLGDVVTPDRRVDVEYEDNRLTAVLNQLEDDKFEICVSTFDLLVEAEGRRWGRPNAPYDWTEAFAWVPRLPADPRGNVNGQYWRHGDRLLYLDDELPMMFWELEKEELSPEGARWLQEHPSIAKRFRRFHVRAATAWAWDARQLELPGLEVRRPPPTLPPVPVVEEALTDVLRYLKSRKRVEREAIDDYISLVTVDGIPRGYVVPARRGGLYVCNLKGKILFRKWGEKLIETALERGDLPSLDELEAPAA